MNLIKIENMKTNNIKQLLIFLIFLLLYSCIEENPNLVNAPPQTSSVGLRFINLSSDQKPRVLDLARQIQTQEIPYGEISESMQPPLDSTYLFVFLNNNEEFRKDRKLRYVRNTNYTVLALPSADDSELYRPMDSLIVLFTSLGFQSNNPKSLLKVFNAYPDSTITFTAALGCPSGEKLSTGLRYRTQSLPKEVRSGLVPVSITKDSAGEKISHLYNLFLSSGSQYCLLVMRDVNGDDVVKLLDESNQETYPMMPLDSVTEKYAEVRPINFSKSDVRITIKHGDEEEYDEVVTENQSAQQIGQYEIVGACLTTSLDELQVEISPFTKSTADVSLEVMERYTHIILDTADNDNGRAALSIILEPLFLDYPLSNNAAIRVVHGAERLEGLTLSIGARDNDTTSIGFSAGDKIANELSYTDVQTAIIPAGIAPLTLFTSDQPSKLLFSTLTEFEAGETYILVITNDADGKPQMSMIKDNDINMPIEYLESASFIQIVHLVPGLEKIKTLIDPVLSNADLYYTGSLATVVERKPQTIFFNDRSINFTPESDKRTIIVAAGTKDEIELFHFNTPPLSSGFNFYQRRFINASKEIPELSVKINSEESDFYSLKDLPYGNISNHEQVNLEKKISMFFIDSRTDTTLLRVDDLALIFGKKYIIIFGGSLDEGGYTAVVQQEM
jgi:hypothetical protein